MSTDILTISEAAALIKAGKLSPVELTEMCLARIRAFVDAYILRTQPRSLSAQASP